MQLSTKTLLLNNLLLLLLLLLALPLPMLLQLQQHENNLQQRWQNIEFNLKRKRRS